jgi:hypothetical protein
VDQGCIRSLVNARGVLLRFRSLSPDGRWIAYADYAFWLAIDHVAPNRRVRLSKMLEGEFSSVPLGWKVYEMSPKGIGLS